MVLGSSLFDLYSSVSGVISSIIYKIEEKIGYFTKKSFISLLIIGVISLSIRLLFFEPDIPIRQDANAYFWYAMDMSILDYFPYSSYIIHFLQLRYRSGV